MIATTGPEPVKTPVAMSATVGGVPQKRGLINEADQQRIRAALRARDDADAELRAAVLTAAEKVPEHNASVRELAAFTGLSTNTISRWKREQS